MIVSAVFVPSTPLLVPVTGAAAPDRSVAALRRATTAAVAALVRPEVDTLVVLGSGPRSRSYSPVAAGTLAPYGLNVEVHLGNPACGACDPLPLSLTVGAWLLRQAVGPRSQARGFSCADGFERTVVAAELLGVATSRRVGLLVVADGAERFPPLAGPGHTPAGIATSARESAAVDDRLARALAAGDGEALAATAVPHQLVRLSSRPAWQATGRLLAGPGVDARLHLRDASHGVGWLVATWNLRD